LQWIDGAVREVETKVTDIEKRVKESGLVRWQPDGPWYKWIEASFEGYSTLQMKSAARPREKITTIT
jgi:hypothetical protein